MSPRDQFTHEEAVLLAKALAKAQARIVDLEEELKDSHEDKLRFRDYWLEDSEKVKQLEQANAALQSSLEMHEAANDITKDILP